jgi:RNA polymerase sigma-70 factor (ECF subfamily)
VQTAHEFYPECPIAYLVSMARTGDRKAFAELVRRRQSAVRGMMRRFCGDPTLADDLAQQVFMKMWLNIRRLRKVKAFDGWLKRLAVSVWLLYLRKKDALRGAGELAEADRAQVESPGAGLDLDQALATLPSAVRLCIVLSYQAGMSHREINELTKIPLGTVKSHINRGSERLRQVLSAYADGPRTETRA